MLAVCGLLGGAAFLVLWGDSLLRPGQAEGLGRRVENWTFWCMTVSALVFGYTSFEVLYRDATARRLALLPVPGGALFDAKVISAYRTHLPLVFLPALTGVPLLWSGHHVFYLQGVGTSLGALLWGLAVAIYAHVWAGRSLLDGATALKKYLASGFGPPETAFLFYSPAFALMAALTVGVLADFGFQLGARRGDWQPLLTVAGVATVVSVLALRKARRIFAAEHHRITPRFYDAEVLPPWREGELPQKHFGEGLTDRLPTAVRPLWRRALLQYRRRFRIMPPLLVVVCIFLVLYAVNTAAVPGGPFRLALAAIALGVIVFTPAFRLAGPELGTRYDARALPVDPGLARTVHWAMAALEWLPLAAAATLGALLAGFGLNTLFILLAVIAAFVVTCGLAIPLAIKSAPEVARVSFGVRGGVLLLVGAASYALQGVAG